MTRIIDEVIPIRSSGKSGGGGVIDDSRSFRIRTHGDTTGTIRHEYECPAHGRFTIEVPRAAVPDEARCRLVLGRGEWELAPVSWTEFCGRRSPWCPPLVAIGVPSGEVTG